MIHRPLDHPLKTEGLLENVFAPFGHTVHLLVEKILKSVFKIINTAAAVFDNFDTGAVVQDGKKYVFYADIFMAPFFSFPHGKTKGSTQFLTDHGTNPSPWYI